MKISRQVGATNQVLNVFVQDATVSTGAGLANVVGSTVSLSWWHNGQLAHSTATASSATSMGNFSTYGWVQISSTAALGWYQLGAPNGVFASGDVALIHMYGATSMAPLPIEIELTGWNNQQSVSTQASSVPVVAYSVTDKAGYGVSSVNTGVNVTSVVNTAAVTTSAGIFATVLDYGRTANQNSTVAFSSVSFSSVSVAVSGVNVTSVAGSAVVTTQAGIFATVFDLGRTANPNSTVAFSSVSFSSVSVAVSGVNVTSVAGSAVVTTAAGVIATTFDLGRTANQNSTVAFSSVSFSSVSVAVSGVNVTSVAGSAVVTSAAGVLATTFDLGRTANLTSTVAMTGVSINMVTTVSLPVTASSVTDKSGYGVSSVNTGVNVSSIVGTAAVTTSAGILATVFDLGRTANQNSTVAFSSVSFSSVSVAVSGVNVTSVAGSAVVTSAAGVIATTWDLGRTANLTSTVALTGLSINVATSVALPTTVSSNTDKSGYALSSSAIAGVADGLLDRDMSLGPDSGSPSVRTVRQGVRFLRNKWTVSGLNLTVYKEDDSTSSWTGTVTASTGADPITGSDPA